MKELNELRRVAGGRNTAIGAEIYKLCDAIERELAERWMELPVDAEGVPIRVGDVVEFGENRRQGIIKALNECMVIAMHVDGDNLNYAKHGLLWNADACRHAKPDTIEDVLRDFAEEWGAWDGCDAETERLMCARYAERIREMVRDDR